MVSANHRVSGVNCKRTGSPTATGADGRSGAVAPARFDRSRMITGRSSRGLRGPRLILQSGRSQRAPAVAEILPPAQPAVAVRRNAGHRDVRLDTSAEPSDVNRSDCEYAIVAHVPHVI